MPGDGNPSAVLAAVICAAVCRGFPEGWSTSVWRTTGWLGSRPKRYLRPLATPSPAGSSLKPSSPGGKVYWLFQEENVGAGAGAGRVRAIAGEKTVVVPSVTATVERAASAEPTGKMVREGPVFPGMGSPFLRHGKERSPPMAETAKVTESPG